jgi:hypothetical protein
MGTADFVLLYSGVLGASSCARPHSAEPPTCHLCFANLGSENRVPNDQLKSLTFGETF